jgi:hypothetical protein
VMIPTLLMNIPNPHQPNNNNQPDNTCLRMALVFFCEFFFFILFVVLSTCGMGHGTTGGIHKNGNRSGRKDCSLLGGGHRQIHRRRKKFR